MLTLRNIAMVLLLAGGLVLVVTGGLVFVETVDSVVVGCDHSGQPFVCGLGQFFFAIGCAMLLTGAAHFAAWVGVMRRNRWAGFFAVILTFTWGGLWWWLVPILLPSFWSA